MDELSQKKFDELVKSDANTFTENDIAFLKARSSYLTETHKKKFASILKAPKKK